MGRMSGVCLFGGQWGYVLETAAHCHGENRTDDTKASGEGFPIGRDSGWSPVITAYGAAEL